MAKIEGELLRRSIGMTGTMGAAWPYSLSQPLLVR